ncbi:hypothetical protein SCUCBS95973_000910 [Sporothrix curviconia]|uniref:SHSP domain-containing protein n=1 Tax=Sporothrix curviconia TaxID=1260050 RepID=A0ABP0AU58_9PEZI
MPFYQRSFFNPVTSAPADQFTNIFQLFNELDSYQQQAAKQQEAQQKAQQQVREQQLAREKQAREQQAREQQAREEQARRQAACAARKAAAAQRHHSHNHHRRAGTSPFNALESLFGFDLSAPVAPRAFSPRFDVRETESTYELHGELAGVERNNVSLEFTEPQTLVISGSIERNYTSSSAAPAAVESAPEAAPEATPEATPAATPEAIADTHSEPSDDGEPILRDGARTPVDDDEPFTEIVAPRTPSPARSHRATVTDEATEEALERGEDITNEKADAAATGEAEVADPDVVTPDEVEQSQQQQQQVQKQEPAAPSERYWVQERAVGQFKRVFNFPVPVDEANVRANLENGILSVSVPKAKREVRRIVVF